jgi:hypothetical protein
MPLWRCPHCGTPQAETARCWVCHRSSTSCATCRNFRGSVAAGLGYCGLDRSRAPLAGDEIRACWEDVGGSPEGPTGDPQVDDWLPDADPTAPAPTPPLGLPVVSPARVAVSPDGARLWVEVDV